MRFFRRLSMAESRESVRRTFRGRESAVVELGAFSREKRTFAAHCRPYRLDFGDLELAPAGKKGRELKNSGHDSRLKIKVLAPWWDKR